MDNLSGPLAQLIRRLDAFQTQPTLVQMTQAIKESKLHAEDVSRFVKETINSYHRALVVRREHYELLVLTWRPGQGSVPHDHSGSVSAMMVLEGVAAEGSYRIADDGYADLEYETHLHEGEMTAWQDAGVHSVRNPSNTKTLITVNIYSPPLKDFRRFIQRPDAIPSHVSNASSPPTVLIVGGGFSGSMTAAQLLKRANLARFPLNVILVERQGSIGEGVAYSTSDRQHLLNVPAGRMSAWPDKPGDFVDWVTSRYGACDPTEFVARAWYGQYTRESLLEASREPGGTASLSVVLDEARRVSRRPDGGWMVSFAKHASVPCDAVVMAIGHRAPSDPIGSNWSGPRLRFLADPWQPFVTNAIAGHDPVVILGSGLTSVDAVLSLTSSSRTAPITLVSRRGLLPQMHSPKPVQPVKCDAWIEEVLSENPTIGAITKAVRRSIESVQASGGDWRSVIDGLRPHTAAIWKALPDRERRRFLRHLRALWEVHRHRTAVAVADRFRELLESGLVRVVAGRVVAAQANESGVRMFIRERGDDRSMDIQASWVLNCTGPGPSNSPDSNPAIGSLLVSDSVQADPLSLGLETTDDGRALNAKGSVTDQLFVVGTLRKPNAWESTAVPELRVQAASVADQIMIHFHPELSANVGSVWSI